MLSIHGSIFSTCTQRVVVSLLEAGYKQDQDFQVVTENDLSKIKSPEWLAQQPFGQMPYLVNEETGNTIFESRAIAKYVGIKAGSPIVASQTDLDAYAKFEMGASIEQSNYDKIVTEIFVETFRKLISGQEIDREKVDKLDAQLTAKLEGYERVLSKQKYIGGDRLTVVDLFHLPFGVLAVQHGAGKGLTDGKLPHVAKWWKELTELPNWKNVWAQREAAFAAMQAAQAAAKQ